MPPYFLLWWTLNVCKCSSQFIFTLFPQNIDRFHIAFSHNIKTNKAWSFYVQTTWACQSKKASYYWINSVVPVSALQILYSMRFCFENSAISVLVCFVSEMTLHKLRAKDIRRASTFTTVEIIDTNVRIIEFYGFVQKNQLIHKLVSAF